MLTEKENYLMHLRGEQPEWVPEYTFAPFPGVRTPVASHMFEPPMLFEFRARGGGPDIWGVNYVASDSAAGAIMPDNSTFILPLEKLSKWRDIIKAPDISGIDWEQVVTKQIKDSGIDRSQSALALNLHMGYFQQLMSFMGFEDGLISFYEEPDEVHALLHYMSDFFMDMADKVLDIYKPDVMTLMDDTAAWNAPFISPELYREFIMPHNEKWAKRARERGLPMTMHNCGKSECFVPIFLELGINAWDPAQTCNDLKGIQEKYGNTLCLHGAWDARDRLIEPDVTDEEIRQSVRDTLDKYAVGGGFAWCGGYLIAIDDEESVRKNKVLMDEFYRYSRDFYKTH